MRPTRQSCTRVFALIAVLVASTSLAQAADDDTTGNTKGKTKKNISEKAAPSPAFRAAMKRFLVAQSVPSQMGEQMTYSAAEQALGALAASGIAITEPMQAIVIEEARKDFAKRFGDVDYLTDLYATVYAKHFSEKEVTELATFWESPIAKKLLSTTTEINEAFAVTLQAETTPMIAALQSRLDKRLRAEGILGGAP